MPAIRGFAWDDENEEELARHGLTLAQVDEVLSSTHLVQRNKRRRRATHRIVGRDNGGAYLTIPIQPTTDSAIWRPVTGWRSTDSERALLERGVSQ